MLYSLFNPKSVAVIGASTREFSMGNKIVKNLKEYGYCGSIYPVNPNANAVLDIPAYPSLLDVPGTVDLVHIVIPSNFVLNAIEDCGKKGVKFIIINSSGFKEIGDEGERLEKSMVALAREKGMRILGPNCQGIINSDPAIKAYCNFTFTKPTPGTISIVAQSGGVGEAINQRFSELGAGVRMYAANGNACDLSIPEIVEYWAKDQNTNVIVLYGEGISDPQHFFEIIEATTRIKPILAMKAGRTLEGAKAAASHTGGIARQEMVSELLLKKAGALVFRDEEEICQAAIAFACQPIPKGKNVGMITNTGGPAIIATDELIEAGLTMPSLSQNAKQDLEKKLFENASVQNPVDVLATAGPQHFRAALDTMMNEDSIDSIFINFVTPFFADTEGIAKEIVKISTLKKKSIICNLMTDKRQWVRTVQILMEGGVPCYSFPESAARALVALTKYRDIQVKDKGEVKKYDDITRDQARQVINSVKKSSQTKLNCKQVFDLLGAYGISTVPWRICVNETEMNQAAGEIGYPIVLKADFAALDHKSDVGGVILNITNPEMLAHSISTMKNKFQHYNDVEYVIQKYIPGGIEIIVGAVSEEKFGHLIMFGLGGIFVEVLKDVSFSLSPVTTSEAKSMLRSINGYPMLKGIRGKKGVDQNKILNLIQRVSQLVTDFPSISEMDLNPVLAFEDRIFVADARIRLSEK